MHPDRIRALREGDPADGRYVLYWMQESQRAAFNPALETAVRRANQLDVPTVVVFGLDPDYPEANVRHFHFLLEGLREVEEALRRRGIRLLVRLGDPGDVALELAEDACELVCDRGYLRVQRETYRRLAEEACCPVTQVEGDVVVPVETVSDKREYAARTIRPKIHRHLDDFLSGLSEAEAARSSLSLRLGDSFGLDEGCLDRLDLDLSVPTVRRFTGGTSQARRRLTRFLRHGLDGYGEGRSEPADWKVSTLGPYLHFGQISPVEVVRKVRSAGAGTGGDEKAFIEELVIRRELAANFVHFTDDYDRYSCLPGWARQTLAEHRDDQRPHRYTRAQLEAADTHDQAWNAAMREMVVTGYMHNTLRMYWAKKILHWTHTPEAAHLLTLELNNRFFLDGRDANSFANVAWCFGLHDRAWQEREVFGKVRIMKRSGLDRKFDVERYVAAVDELCRREEDRDE